MLIKDRRKVPPSVGAASAENRDGSPQKSAGCWNRTDRTYARYDSENGPGRRPRRRAATRPPSAASGGAPHGGSPPATRKTAAAAAQRSRDLVVPLLFLQLGPLVLGARAKAGDVEDCVYSSVYSAICGGVDSRMASVCSNLSVEISCADVAAAWSLPPACDMQKKCKKNAVKICRNMQFYMQNA